MNDAIDLIIHSVVQVRVRNALQITRLSQCCQCNDFHYPTTDGQGRVSCETEKYLRSPWKSVHLSYILVDQTKSEILSGLSNTWRLDDSKDRVPRYWNQSSGLFIHVVLDCIFLLLVCKLTVMRSDDSEYKVYMVN